MMHDGDGVDDDYDDSNDSDSDSEVIYTHFRMFINIISIIAQPH